MLAVVGVIAAPFVLIWSIVRAVTKKESEETASCHYRCTVVYTVNAADTDQQI